MKNYSINQFRIEQAHSHTLYGMSVCDTNFLIIFLFLIFVLSNFNYTTADDPGLWFAIFKVLPIVWLLFCVKYLNKLIGRNNNYNNKCGYYNHVSNGLLAAIVGDICLVWPKNTFFLSAGIVAFSFTHYFYANYLGFHPLKVKVLIFYCLPVAAINMFLIFNKLQGKRQMHFCTSNIF